MNGSSRRKFFAKWVFLCLAGAIYLGWLLAGLRDVPFHPDEATWIYMSRDLDRVLAQGPAALCWQVESAGDPLQVERERACPLTRYLTGFARLLTGAPATSADWNWSAGWEENIDRGAMPSESVLLAARVPQALLLFLSTLLMFRLGWRVGGWPGAISAGLFFGLNSQMLLHGRRAMSEAALLFGMILMVALLLEQKDKMGRIRWAVVLPLLAGVALAIAVSAKLSGLLVVPVALVGMFVMRERQPLRSMFAKGAARLAVMLSSSSAFFLLMNPLYWCHPWAAFMAVISSRNSLLIEQAGALRSAAPGLMLDVVPMRLLAAFFQSFLAPLAYWDIPNYAAVTAGVERAYASNPMLVLTSTGVLPIAWCTLCFFGMIVGLLRIIQPTRRGHMVLLWVWFLAVVGGILLAVPIMWQRYYLPLIPVLVIWASLGISAISGGIQERWMRFKEVGSGRN